MILKRQEFIWNHGWLGCARMKKAMLARPVPGLAAFLQVHFQASLKMALQKLRSIRFANGQRWPRPPAEDWRVAPGDRRGLWPIAEN